MNAPLTWPVCAKIAVIRALCRCYREKCSRDSSCNLGTTHPATLRWHQFRLNDPGATVKGRGYPTEKSDGEYVGSAPFGDRIVGLFEF